MKEKQKTPSHPGVWRSSAKYEVIEKLRKKNRQCVDAKAFARNSGKAIGRMNKTR